MNDHGKLDLSFDDIDLDFGWDSMGIELLGALQAYQQQLGSYPSVHLKKNGAEWVGTAHYISNRNNFQR